MVVIATGDHRRPRDALGWNCLSKAWQRGDPDPRSMRVDRGFFCFRGQIRFPVENRSDPMCRRSASILVDPRHAWMDHHRNRTFRQFIKQHPRMAWIYCRTREIVEGGVGPLAGA
ncbi:hypothetical protein E4416_07755 [Stenotrophomonas maltophilia]|nr:hypothetical protein E4418_12985 [Stenotrophomonas maltophilia]TIK73706.1 hypothetical protein E4416_07755 [Stenotrophomonas maltophilia]